jgi:hypothetical protein
MQRWYAPIALKNYSASKLAIWLFILNVIVSMVLKFLFEITTDLSYILWLEHAADN